MPAIPTDEIVLPRLACAACGHTWVPRTPSTARPRQCPRCQKRLLYETVPSVRPQMQACLHCGRSFPAPKQYGGPTVRYCPRTDGMEGQSLCQRRAGYYRSKRKQAAMADSSSQPSP